MPPRPTRSCWPLVVLAPCHRCEGTVGVPACLAALAVRPLSLLSGTGVPGRVVGMGSWGAAHPSDVGPRGLLGTVQLFPFSHEMKTPQFWHRPAPQRSFSLLLVAQPPPLPRPGCESGRTAAGMPRTEGFGGKLAVP